MAFLLSLICCCMALVSVGLCCFGGGGAPEGYPDWMYKKKYVQDCYSSHYGGTSCSVREDKELRRIHFDPRSGEEYTEPVGRWLMRNVFTTVQPTLPDGRPYFPPPKTKSPKRLPVGAKITPGRVTVTPAPGIDIGTDGDYFDMPNRQTTLPWNQMEAQFVYDNNAAPQQGGGANDFFSLDEVAGMPEPTGDQPVFINGYLVRSNNASSASDNQEANRASPDKKPGHRKRRPVLIGVLKANGTDFVPVAGINGTLLAKLNSTNVTFVQFQGPNGTKLVVMPKEGSGKKRKLKKIKINPIDASKQIINM